MTLPPEKRGLPALFVFLGTSCFGWIGWITFHAQSAGLTRFPLLFWRFLIAGILLSLWSRHRQVNLGGMRSFLQLLFLGFLYFLESATFFVAMGRIGSAMTFLIFYSYPIGVFLWERFAAKEPLSGWKMISLVVITIGVVLVSNVFSHIASDTEAPRMDIVGVLLALSSALSYSVYLILGRKFTKGLPAYSTTAVVCLGCAICYLVTIISRGELFVPTQADHLAYVGLMAFICTIIPLSAILYGIGQVGPTMTSLLSTAEPLMAFLVGVTLLHEKMSGLQIFGAGLVLLGTVLSQWSHKEDVNEKRATVTQELSPP